MNQALSVLPPNATIETLPATDPELESFLMKDIDRYLYIIGDLEEPYASRSRFVVLRVNGAIAGCSLVYTDGVSVLLCYSSTPCLQLAWDVHRLQGSFGFHVTDPQLPTLQKHCTFSRLQPFSRMMLRSNGPFEADSKCRLLTPGDLTAALDLKTRVPDIWFTEHQFASNTFVGWFSEDNTLAGMVGTHVENKGLGVAAVGSMGVDPAFRRRGLGRRLMTTLLHHLVPRTQAIGLNVRADNTPAIKLYEQLGFVHVLSYNEGDANVLA